MDDELAAMNASLDDAQNEFMDEEDVDEHHNKIEVDTNPDQKSQEITDASGKIDERDEVALDPDSKSQVDQFEPSTKSDTDKDMVVDGGSNLNEDEHVEEDQSQKSDQDDNSEVQDTQEGTDPATELQDKAGDNLKEGEESIFKNNKGLTKDDAMVDDAQENKEEDTTREGSVSRMITSMIVFMVMCLA